MENVGRSLSEAVRKLLRMPNVDEKAVKELVKDLQRTLLQADVNVELVLQLSRAVEDRSLKQTLPPGIARHEHVVKVLYEEMTKFVGHEPAKTDVQPGQFRKVMLVGIQGTGKTTSTVKLARFYTKRGLRVGIVCADTYRPGAYDQLVQLATKAEIPVYGEPGGKKPEDIAKRGIESFGKKSDLVIIDTAGRHRNERDLMDEMKRIASAVKPDEIVLAIDGTIGQQAIHQARAFHEATPIGSVLLTKMDGSAKGGGALSAVVATGSRVKFIGTGERVEDLEQFVPTDFVGRLLGMGDLNALLEKVKEAEITVPETKVRRFMEGRFTLKDMYEQMENLRKMGPLRKVLQMVPGGVNLPEEQLGVAEEKMTAWRVIIRSMTKNELEEPRLVDGSRARRIARGSGRSEREVRELVNQYFTMKKVLKQMKRRGPMMKGMPFLKK
ncbi:MAG TPA: signal recognition particle protein Srp54 [Candidatus Bathyarchaeia archaeon]|nr:signal recognition particle protein Srp54 [Candidatus Bathyarchaeia archaeon]